MLELDHVRAAYGPATALRDVSLSVAAGELVCVVGPNGAGKTTLINVIAGLNRVAEGRLAIDGVDLARLPPHGFCAQGIALVPEARRLFTGLSVRDNLELGAYRREARRAKADQFERVLAIFPILRERLNTQAGLLSGGQQQMVAIGRALMARPRLLLLDEPSLGLAPAIVLDMLRVVSAINRDGVAVLLVEQNVAMALEIATRAYVLEEGHIVGEGAPAELMAQPHIRRAYLGESGPG
jgi:branched-chain amino acid transport system ATP-binding protein